MSGRRELERDQEVDGCERLSSLRPPSDASNKHFKETSPNRKLKSRIASFGVIMLCGVSFTAMAGVVYYVSTISASNDKVVQTSSSLEDGYKVGKMVNALLDDPQNQEGRSKKSSDLSEHSDRSSQTLVSDKTDGPMFGGMVIDPKPTQMAMPSSIPGMQRSDEIDPEARLTLQPMENGHMHVSLMPFRLSTRKTDFTSYAYAPESRSFALKSIPSLIPPSGTRAVEAPEPNNETQIIDLPIPAPILVLATRTENVAPPLPMTASPSLVAANIPAKLSSHLILQAVPDAPVLDETSDTDCPVAPVSDNARLPDALTPPPILDASSLDASGAVQPPDVIASGELQPLILPGIMSASTLNKNDVRAPDIMSENRIPDIAIPDKIKPLAVDTGRSTVTADVPSAFLRPEASEETPSIDAMRQTLIGQKASFPQASDKSSDKQDQSDYVASSANAPSLTEVLNRLNKDGNVNDEALPPTEKRSVDVTPSAHSDKVDTLADALRRLRNVKGEKSKNVQQ